MMSYRTAIAWLLVALVAAVIHSGSADGGFHEQTTGAEVCEDASMAHAVQASAMLQKRARTFPEKTLAPQLSLAGSAQGAYSMARLCAPESLQQVHSQAVRRHVAFIGSSSLVPSQGALDYL